MMLWHIGNTTVRSPYRLREALRLLSTSALQGNLSGKRQEEAFAQQLHAANIVSSTRLNQASENRADDLGRKWRAALMQLGFLTPKLSKAIDGGIDHELLKYTKSIAELTGRPFEITPNGYRLLNSETVGAMQDCFLRALLAYRIPSQIESRYQMPTFSPIHFLLKVFTELSAHNYEAILSFHEYALFVQTSHYGEPIPILLNQMMAYRHGRAAVKGRIKSYDKYHYDQIAEKLKKKAGTLKDYADLSLRYLKATGLFQTTGRGITIAKSKQALVKLLMEKSPITEDYFIPLWQGSFLPTDNQQLATQVVNALYQELVEKGEAPPAIPISPSLDTLHQLRHHYEQRLSQLAELTYANEQRNCFDDILLWLRAIETGKSQRKQSGEKIQVPSGEGPVYLEWIIWRAFLAINALCNMPWEGRRFKIDQDFMPISCAPSGGPDMIMEFEEMALVIEVTLTTSSRQEAAEGEPVRRHVAQLADHYKNKAVYGLFLAKRIDSNTAHTFRSGDWYRKDDSKLSLQIIPLTLSDFYFLLTNYQKGLNKLSNDMRSLLIECRASANESAPKWKQCIHDIVKRFCERNRRRDE